MRTDMINKITIKQRVTTQDDYGAATESWEDFKTNIWCAKEPLLGNEYYTASSNQSKVELKFRTQYMAGITNVMRIFDSDGQYEILSVINPKSQNRELLFYCKKVV